MRCLDRPIFSQWAPHPGHHFLQKYLIPGSPWVRGIYSHPPPKKAVWTSKDCLFIKDHCKGDLHHQELCLNLPEKAFSLPAPVLPALTRNQTGSAPSLALPPPFCLVWPEGSVNLALLFPTPSTIPMHLGIYETGKHKNSPRLCCFPPKPRTSHYGLFCLRSCV